MTDAAQGTSPRWHPRGLNNGAIVGATYYGVSYLPAWLTYRIGHVGTWLAYHLQRQGTRALVENFAVIFPDRTPRQLHALALRTYRSYARDVIDFIRSLRMTPAQMRAMVGRFDTAAFEQALAEGQGAIILSGHFGNWEMGGVLLRRLTPYALSVVAKAEPSETVTRLRQDLRNKLGIETIQVRQHLETALRIRARLQKNEVVAMLLDRHLGKDHVEVSFFGRPTKFLRTPAVMASLSGAPLVPCFVYRDDRGVAIECGPLIRVSSEGDRDANVRDAIQAVAALIEGHIRRNPQYWYQFYPFWPAPGASPDAGGETPR
jgi:KDO2-lipid IV(A) lauroyltransferase